MKVALLSVLVILSLLLEDTLGRMGGGGGYKRRNQDRWRRRPWEVGYFGNRNNPRRPWDRTWRREKDRDEFVVKTERPRYYENEEKGCTGLCLIKKMEALDAKIQKKKAKKVNKDITIEITEAPKPKKKSAPCTGMCAIVRQRTG
eukprot:TRINITY_DN13394_c0_g1_i1.p1 TRINITY_DN13394_c0_g1~~TRINITY_DN13394_c0_g1_i1.p1  ORF type:complete len:145 (-),score=37.53 TRINITY_DN13394_c0_g1_i1:135-569(-)